VRVHGELNLETQFPIEKEEEKEEKIKSSEKGLFFR
jgi:hypothetical protein